MKQRQISSPADVRNKVFLLMAAGFTASLLLSMTMVGLAVRWVLHN